MGGINEATEVARGISEQGFLVMTAAFFLVLSAMMMVACFKWFKSIITKSMEDYGESLKELIEKTNDQNNMLSDISEGLRPETQLRIKNMTSEFFNLSARRVLEIIEQVRKENHISDMKKLSEISRTSTRTGTAVSTTLPIGVNVFHVIPILNG